MIITGGGTAGHVTPLLAVATDLKKQYPDISIRYIGKRGDSLNQLISENDSIDKQYKIFAGKWRRYHGVSVAKHLIDIKTLLLNIRDIIYFILGLIQSLVIQLFWRPNIVFVKGGFVGLPVGLAAALLRIPIVTHDSDSVPGLTNRILSRYAKLQAVGLPIEVYKNYYSTDKLRYTGIPIREDYWHIDKEIVLDTKNNLNISSKDKVITIFGGSLGAVRINNVVLDSLNVLSSINNLKIIWITGKNQYKEIKQKLNSEYKNESTNIILYSFYDDMFKLMAIADLVISRAGATSIAEIAALKKPSIIIPSPYLTGGHQTKNAKALDEANASVVISEKDIKEQPSIFGEKIIKTIRDKTLLINLSNNIQHFVVKDSSSKIVSTIIEAQKR